jgi:hypothetical protein
MSMINPIISCDANMRMNRLFRIIAAVFFFVFVAAGCAHYPVNDPLTEYTTDDS